jgi:hypothetical protein
METEKLQPVRDGYRTFGGGGDVSALAPGDFRPDQFWKGINISIAGRRISPRPGWEYISPAFQSDADQRTWETGLVQGSCEYRGAKVTAIDGHLFSYDPLRQQVYRVDPPTGRALSKFSRHIYFCPRAGSLVVQDGVNNPVIVTGRRGRLADASPAWSSNASPELRVGTVMADCGGWLHIASPGRTKFWVSDHEMDVTSTPFLFREADDYYLGAPSIQAPSDYGEIRGMAAFFDSELLAVWHAKRLRLYNVALPRSKWAEQDIVARSLASGLAGHQAIAARDNIIYYVDQDGRLTSLAEVQESQGRLEIRRIDNEVLAWIKGETARERESIHLADFAGRLLRTCGPEHYAVSAGSPDHRTGIRWRGLLSLNYDIKSTLAGIQPAAWEQLWTGPCITSMTSVDVGGQSHLYVMSRDDDGINRLYRLRPDRHYDVAPTSGAFAGKRRRIQWRVHLREFDGGERSLNKDVSSVALTASELRGRVDLRVFSTADGNEQLAPWFSHSDAAADCLEQDAVAGTYLQPAPQGRAPIFGPKKPPEPVCDPTGRRLDTFCSLRPVIEGAGYAVISEFALELKFKPTSTKGNATAPECAGEITPKPGLGCGPDDYEFNFLSAPIDE